MNYIIVDLEATCWKDPKPEKMETIEIGAVKLNASLAKGSSDSWFVQPVEEPILSDFCKELTHIKQEDIDSAPKFPQAFADFVYWTGFNTSNGDILCSWGGWDKRQLLMDCGRHGIRYPFGKNHINIKVLFAIQQGIKPCSTKKALNRLGITFDGTPHRALDDARNITKIAQAILGGRE